MIVHLCDQEKFMPAFVDMIESANLGLEQRYFVCLGRERYAFKPRSNLVIVTSFSDIHDMLDAMISARKIILHGLYFDVASKLLLEHPELLSKCYWSMWGNDFYYPEQQPEWRKALIKKIPYWLTRNVGDFELARSWYDTDAELLECTGYPSNAFEFAEPRLRSDELVNVQIGNSADPENAHLEVLEALARIEDVRFHAYAPLSYGSDDNARAVAEAGQQLLGDRFFPLLDYLDLESYYAFLATMDIAIFNHRKQQAMGNIIHLLGFGKKVYLHSDLSSWHTLVQDGFAIHDLNEGVELVRIAPHNAQKNHNIVTQAYSFERVLHDWTLILGHTGCTATYSAIAS